MLPPQHMAELYAVHPSRPWRWVQFDDGRHLDAYDTHAAEYWPALRAFVADVLADTRRGGGDDGGGGGGGDGGSEPLQREDGEAQQQAGMHADL